MANNEETLVQSTCEVCRTTEVDPDFGICDACERRYPRLLISAALADPESREVYLARLVTGETVKFRYAALDGEYVMLWGLKNGNTCAPEVRGGPPEKLLNINVRADAIVYVAELPPLPARETPVRENMVEKLMEDARRRLAAELCQAAPEGGRNDAA
jgi:hypothetical protein